MSPGSIETDRLGEPIGVEKAIDLGRFEEVILPHLHAAHNLARWLLRSSADAEDLVQEASLRAWQSSARFAEQRSRLAARHRPEYLLHLAAEKSPAGTLGRIR